MNFILRVINRLKLILDAAHSDDPTLAQVASLDYWIIHNVTTHKQLMSPEESNHFLRWRFDE
jgi:microsomal dipeptidase-like Zn-dependent dipeptidase